MEALPQQFSDAVRNVRVSDEKLARTIDAHSEVRSLLESDPELCDWGIDTILIGSYARRTSRYPGKDVDVFLRFAGLSTNSDPEVVYSAVKRVLVAEYGLKDEDPLGRVSLQARSLKIDFADPLVTGGDLGFCVDAVPAVPWDSNWGIPNRDSEQWGDPENRWIETNPIELADRINELAVSSDSPTVGGDNAFRPIARLVRQVRHVHLGDQKPGGLYCEIATYLSWSESVISGSTWAELLAGTLDALGDRFQSAVTEGMLDPVLNTPLLPELEATQWQAAATTFSDLASYAREGLDSEKCKAAKIWRDILGGNDRGPVLPLPDGCDANGFPISAISAVEAVGSNDPRGFA